MLQVARFVVHDHYVISFPAFFSFPAFTASLSLSFKGFFMFGTIFLFAQISADWVLMFRGFRYQILVLLIAVIWLKPANCFEADV